MGATGGQGFADPFSRGDPQDGDPNAAIRDQDATQWKNDNCSPYNEYDQLIERDVWAGQLQQDSKVTEKVEDEVVRTEGQLSQEEGEDQVIDTREKPGSNQELKTQIFPHDDGIA